MPAPQPRLHNVDPDKLRKRAHELGVSVVLLAKERRRSGEAAPVPSIFQLRIIFADENLRRARLSEEAKESILGEINAGAEESLKAGKRKGKRASD